MRRLIIVATLFVTGTAAADTPTQLTSFRDCPDCPEMVALPTGSFVMGSSEDEIRRAALPEDQAARERPAHRVELRRRIALGKFEVTVGEYAAFATQTARPLVAGCLTWDTAAGKWGPVAAASWREPGYPQTDRFPVGCVTIDDARAYAAWLAQKSGQRYRIPSEAEWEYAARAGTRDAAWDDPQGICRRANVSDLTRMDAHGGGPRDPTRYFDCRDGFVAASPVGSFPADPWGVHDLVGNAWEWTEDCFVADYAGAPADGSARRDAACERLVVRGGGWYSRTFFARPAGRSREEPGFRSSTLGFRVVRELE